MAKTSVDKVDKTENVENQEDIKKQLADERSKNQQLEDKMNQLQAMMEQLMKTQNKVEEPVKKESKNKIEYKYQQIDPSQRVFVMNLASAGGTYRNIKGAIMRFDGFGEIQPTKFEDLELFVSKYRNYFENMELRILDEDVIDALYLRKSYEKHKITKEKIEEILDLPAQKMVNEIDKLPKNLQNTVISLFIKGVVENDERCMDRNKWAVLGNYANIDISEIAHIYGDILVS